MRPQLESFKLCYSSWFRLHTETGNIWSHFIGFIGFVVLFFVAVLFPLSMSIMENVLGGLRIDKNAKLEHVNTFD